MGTKTQSIPQKGFELVSRSDRSESDETEGPNESDEEGRFLRPPVEDGDDSDKWSVIQGKNETDMNEPK